MTQILSNSKNNTYISPELIDKYIYYSTENQDSYLYYIFTIKSIDPESNIYKVTYHTNKCYLFMVPKLKSSKAFIYDNYNTVTIKSNEILYEMSFSEYVNIFRTFVQNDGKLVSELPSKIIQDI